MRVKFDLNVTQQPEHRVSKAQSVSYTDVKLISVRKKPKPAQFLIEGLPSI